MHRSLKKSQSHNHDASKLQPARGFGAQKTSICARAQYKFLTKDQHQPFITINQHFQQTLKLFPSDF